MGTTASFLPEISFSFSCINNSNISEAVEKVKFSIETQTDGRFPITSSNRNRFGGSIFAVIFATECYGCTKDELCFIKDNNTEKFIIRMCEKFQENITKAFIAQYKDVEIWKPNADGKWGEIPDGLVTKIITKYKSMLEARQRQSGE